VQSENAAEPQVIDLKIDDLKHTITLMLEGVGVRLLDIVKMYLMQVAVVMAVLLIPGKENSLFEAWETLYDHIEASQQRNTVVPNVAGGTHLPLFGDISANCAHDVPDDQWVQVCHREATNGIEVHFGATFMQTWARRLLLLLALVVAAGADCDFSPEEPSEEGEDRAPRSSTLYQIH
jgi:hypothetical protein